MPVVLLNRALKPLAVLLLPDVRLASAPLPSAVLPWPRSKTPVGPGGPVGPVAPVAPVAPAGPMGPGAPAGPVAPVAPAGPMRPVGPGGPGGRRFMFLFL